MVYRSVPNHTQYTCPVSVLVFSSHSLSTKVSELGYFLKKSLFSKCFHAYALLFPLFFFFCFQVSFPELHSMGNVEEDTLKKAQKLSPLMECGVV